PKAGEGLTERVFRAMSFQMNVPPEEVAGWDVGRALADAKLTQPTLPPEPAALSPNALAVLERGYLRKDQQGQIVGRPGERCARVARAVAAPDARYGGDAAATEQSFLRMLTTLEFVPNSPTLMNAGRELGQLSACFTLPVEDSIGGIFDAVKWAAQIQMTG